MKGKSRVLITVGIILLGFMAVMFFAFHGGGPNAGFSFPDLQFGTATSSVDLTSGRAIPDGFKEYYNPHYHFSILYPNTLTAKEFSGTGDSMTVTFEYVDKTIVSGFQIFIVPFSGTKITEARFKEDDPSGVRDNPRDINVDGALGGSFYSKDHILGDTAEAWFIRDGYLYETTTFKELTGMLSDVMQNWQFK